MPHYILASKAERLLFFSVAVHKVGHKVKYHGYIMRNELKDDDAMQRQCWKLHTQANLLAHTFPLMFEQSFKELTLL